MASITSTRPRPRRTPRRRNLSLLPEERRGSRGQIVRRLVALSIAASR